jgi:biotin carboxyl carrier protein
MSTADTRFNDAAAFFTLFRGSPWKSCHLRAGGIEIFVSRDPGVANPMTGAPAELRAAEAPAVSAPATTLRAPHLGTLLALAEIGKPLEPGQAFAQLDLLGETIDLVSEMGGTVADHLLTIGALAEYDQPLLLLG